MDFSPVWPVIWRGKNSPCFYIFIFLSDVVLREQGAHAADLPLATVSDGSQNGALWGPRGFLGQQSPVVPLSSKLLCSEQVAGSQAWPETLGGFLVFGHLLTADSWVVTR